jgi:membrane fusion protein, copper/silver efflux system
VPEAQAAQVRAGNAVTATIPGGEPLQGKVGAVLPEIDATTRTLKVRVELPNPKRQLVPGMFATLHLEPPARADALLIPSEALIATGERNLVMVAKENGSFMPVEVERGLEANGQTEIRKGLQAGQRVVLSGQFLVDSEASLKGVLARQGAASEPAAASGAKR